MDHHVLTFGDRMPWHRCQGIRVVRIHLGPGQNLVRVVRSAGTGRAQALGGIAVA